MRTKIGLSGLVVLGLVIGSLVASGIVRADDAPAKKHHHHHHGIHGKVTAVNGNDITVAVHQHHKKGEAKVAPESKTFTITDKTKIEIVGEDGTKTAGTVGALLNAHVTIHADSAGVVEEISVGGHHHHHGKKPAA